MAKVSDIVKNGFCLGCGLCMVIDKDCKMVLNNKGFYTPKGVSSDSSIQKNIRKVCPGINVCSNSKNNTEVWGTVRTAFNAWAKDEQIRHTSSSGGVTSALAIYLLESHEVDAILHVGNCGDNYLHNKLYVSRSRTEVLSRNSSRYAPALVFDNILEYLNDSQECFAFIGKPCDIAGMQNLLRLYPHLAGKIRCFLGIFCAGMPSYNATLKAVRIFNKNEDPISLKYRGDGWPGYFTASYADGSSCRMTYNESWGKILGRDLGFRCKICPDGIGMLADIASGDSWNTKDGYPDFNEALGKNFCFIRTQIGEKLFENAHQAGYIEIECLNVKDVKDMQRYQFERRHYAGWRVFIVQLLSGGMLHFEGLGLMSMAIKANWIRAIRDMLGTLKRFSRIKRNNG